MYLIPLMQNLADSTPDIVLKSRRISRIENAKNSTGIQFRILF